MLHSGSGTAGCTIAILLASTVVSMAHGNGIEEPVAFIYHGVGGGLVVLLISLFFVKEPWPLKLGLFLLSPFLAILIGMAWISAEPFFWDSQVTGENETAAAWFGFAAEVVPSLLILATMKAMRWSRESRAIQSGEPEQH